MSTYTYTSAYTRAQAVVDQIDVLFREAGVDASSRAKICHGVRNRWFSAVGLYLAKASGRVYEVEAQINWRDHSDVAELEFNSDLPGWEKNGSPEALILGRRFASTAASHSLEVHYWGRVTPEIRRDPAEHRRVCDETGLSFGGGVPDWSGTPRTTNIWLQDIAEMGASVRSTL
jgi:hypothetical protein